jgi:hypothetical protein
MGQSTIVTVCSIHLNKPWNSPSPGGWKPQVKVLVELVSLSLTVESHILSVSPHGHPLCILVAQPSLLIKTTAMLD